MFIIAVAHPPFFLTGDLTSRSEGGHPLMEVRP